MVGGILILSLKVLILMNDLLANLDKLHTTELGIMRIRRNLGLDCSDVVDWCKEKIKVSEINHKGKNWYATFNECIITINARSFTIITAHKKRRKI